MNMNYTMKNTVLLFFAFFFVFNAKTQTVLDIVVNSPAHETLESAVIAAGLNGTLSGPGPFTVFAPTDDAFTMLSPAMLTTLFSDPSGILSDYLKYHIVNQELSSGDLFDGQVLNMFDGNTTDITVPASIQINDATLTVLDIPATNGVVHVIDVVLIPPMATTVMNIIADSPDHGILETAILAAELDDDLSGVGPNTVFAPTDDAFNALPAGVLTDLLLDPTGALANVLLYHVYGGTALSTDLSDGMIITMQDGNDVEVTINGTDVMINNALVTAVDMIADNGVVHIVDAVIMPSLPSTVVEIIEDSPDHTILETAVIAAQLDDDLSGAGPFTVFAPTDDAFNALPAGVLSDLLLDPIGALADVLVYHVFEGTALSTDLSDGMMITMLDGNDVEVMINGTDVMINDALVTVADLIADNGVVHVIDAVLLPPSAEPASVFEIIANSPDHTVLETAILAAGLDGALSDPETLTVFAPTDAAFGLIPPADLAVLLAMPAGALTDILLYHVAGQTFLSSDLSDGLGIETLEGSEVTISIDGSTVMVDAATVAVPDLTADNGVVHVIDMVLLPPVGLSEVKELGIQVYPNPTADILYVTGNEGLDLFEIYDLKGDRVMSFRNFNESSLDLSGLPSGVYQILIRDLNNSATMSIIRK